MRQSVWSLGNDNGGVGITADGRWELIAVSIIPDTASNVQVEFDEWTHVAVFRGGNGAELCVTSGVPPIVEPDVFHLLVGKLEINAVGVDEFLSVWLNPSGEEEGDDEIFVQGDVVTGLDAFTG